MVEVAHNAPSEDYEDTIFNAMADFTDIILNDLIKLENIIPEIATAFGIEAVNHFTESFDNQGFDGDSGKESWPEVKRRDPSSSWYGFKYGSKQKKPSNHPSRKGAKGKYKSRKKGAITNFAKNATVSPILSSQKSELENSVRHQVLGNTVRVYSDKKYAAVQNEGGSIKVFGKKTVKLKARKFMGNSKSLEDKLKIKANLIFKQKTGR